METVIEGFRRFNRTWTEVIGLLDRGLLDTDHSLAEARVIFELAQRDSWERLELRERLGMDPSFLSRVVGRLVDERLVTSEPSATDGRAVVLALTRDGRRVYDLLNSRSTAQVASLVEPLTADQRPC